jgi:hypothetical protein
MLVASCWGAPWAHNMLPTISWIRFLLLLLRVLMRPWGGAITPCCRIVSVPEITDNLMILAYLGQTHEVLRTDLRVKHQL